MNKILSYFKTLEKNSISLLVIHLLKYTECGYISISEIAYVYCRHSAPNLVHRSFQVTLEMVRCHLKRKVLTYSTHRMRAYFQFTMILLMHYPPYKRYWASGVQFKCPWLLQPLRSPRSATLCPFRLHDACPVLVSHLRIFYILSAFFLSLRTYCSYTNQPRLFHPPLSNSWSLF